MVQFQRNAILLYYLLLDFRYTFLYFTTYYYMDLYIIYENKNERSNVQ